jgi:sec-independent protein translocase protein TatA
MGLSVWHVMIFGFIALLLFGERLPSVMRSLGGSMKEFKRGMDEVHNDVRRSMEQVAYEPAPEKPAVGDGQHGLGAPAGAEIAPAADPITPHLP